MGEFMMNKIMSWIFKWLPAVVFLLAVLFIVGRLLDSSGSELWSVRANGNTRFEVCALDNGTIFALKNDGTLMALSCETGAEKWTSQLGIKFQPDVEMSAANGNVVVSGQDSFAVVGQNDGKRRWGREGIASSNICFCSEGILIAGTQIVETESSDDVSPEEIDDITTGDVIDIDISEEVDDVPLEEIIDVPPSNTVSMAEFFDISSGKLKWKYDIGAECVAMISAGKKLCAILILPPDPVEEEDEKDEKNENKKAEKVTLNPTVIAVDTVTGGKSWSREIRIKKIRGISVIDGGVVINGEKKVCFFSDGGKEMISRDIETGSATVEVSPHGILILGCNGKLTAFSMSSGQVLWEKDVPGDKIRHLVDGDVLYLTTLVSREQKIKIPGYRPTSKSFDVADEIVLRRILESPDKTLAKSLSINNYAQTVFCWNISNGLERWNRDPRSGAMFLSDDGFVLMDYPVNTAKVGSPLVPTDLSLFSRKTGRQLWKYKTDMFMKNVLVWNGMVFAIREGLSDNASGGTQMTSEIIALKGRGKINRMTKF